MQTLRRAVRLAIVAAIVAIAAPLVPSFCQEKPENLGYLFDRFQELPAPTALEWSIEAPEMRAAFAPKRGFYSMRVAGRLERDIARLPSVVDRPDEGLGLADAVYYDVVRDDAERALGGAARRAARNYLLEVSGIEAFRQSLRPGSSVVAEASAGPGSTRRFRPTYDLRLSDDSIRIRLGMRGESSRVHFDLGSDGELGLGWRFADAFRESFVAFRYEPDLREYRVFGRFGF